MSILTIRFMGICQVLDARPNSKDRFLKRVLLPVDTLAADRNDGTHIPYLEVDVLDEVRWTGSFANQVLYPRDLQTYRRFHLSGDRITIQNAVTPAGGTLNVLSTYVERIPSLTKVEPRLTTQPFEELYADDPPADKVAACFDIYSGDLQAGPPGIYKTRFSAPTNWPTRRLARWFELQVPIQDGEGPTIQIESFNGNGRGKRTIQLSPIADQITIGNQLLPDIERPTFDATMTSGEDFRAHFSLFYGLFPAVPANASRPEPTFSVVNGCVGNQYP